MKVPFHQRFVTLIYTVWSLIFIYWTGAQQKWPKSGSLRQNLHFTISGDYIVRATGTCSICEYVGFVVLMLYVVEVCVVGVLDRGGDFEGGEEGEVE